jgi:predicted SAM-dependent methyltransferase
LERRFKEFEHANISINFLDIAPDVVLSKWIKSWKCINYRSVDLFMDEVDDKADITDLHIYEDEKFDVLLCSHVLEHIEHDEKAIAELFRVLKRGGFAIIMVPILLNLENDYENFNLKTPEERWKHFGQDDHVRLYSKNGFVSKLKKAGFKVEQLGENYFGTSVFDKNGIHPRSVLYIVEK